MTAEYEPDARVVLPAHVQSPRSCSLREGPRYSNRTRVAIPIDAAARARYVPTRGSATSDHYDRSHGRARASPGHPQEHAPEVHADDHMSPTRHRHRPARCGLTIAPQPGLPRRSSHDDEAPALAGLIRQSSKAATLRVFLAATPEHPAAEAPRRPCATDASTCSPGQRRIVFTSESV